MKKILTISIALLYLAVSGGLALEIHHCMGKITDITILPSPVEKCGKCGMKKGANECCKDELKFVKLQDAHKLITADYQINVPVAKIDHHYNTANYNFTTRLAVINHKNHAPPDCASIPFFKINCVYRI